MQQEAGEVQSEDKKASILDKNKKRRFKTPDQVVALEKFYNEHKYPSEELKSEFALSLGLSEKQISGWFCHRRLKDKRLVSGEASNGKQDRSSGIIIAPDHNSIHKQDSCGSTKEGHFDHREVQSKGGSCQDQLFDANVAYGDHHHHHQTMPSSQEFGVGVYGDHHDRKLSDFDDDDDTSSDSDDADVARTKTNLMGNNRTRAGPSGYLKMKGPLEHPAIASVKKQMGREYRGEDGPPLVVQFDQIPPGAFQNSMNNPVNEPHYHGIPDLHHSPDGPRILSRPDIVTSNAVYNAGMSSHGHHNTNGNMKPIQRPVFSNRYTPFSKPNSEAETNEDLYSHEMPVYDRRPFSQQDFHRRRKDYLINGKQRGSYSYKSEDLSPGQVQRPQYFESRYSNAPAKLSKPFDMENRGLSRRMSKDDNFVKGRAVMNESFDSARVQGGKRVHEELLEQPYRKNALKTESPLWTNQIKRSAAADMPSSFSEDETEVPSSSGD